MKYTVMIMAYILCALLVSCTPSSTEWKPLFSGENLDNWDKYLGPPFPGLEERAKQATPENVFSIIEVDGENVLRISGEVHGSVATKETFENYHLRLVFKWGDDVPHERNSGLLYHSYGDFGASYWTWMSSVECQLMHDNLGDTYLMTDEITCEASVDEREDRQYYYRPEAIKVPCGVYTNRRMIRKMQNAERPLGQWNTVDLYCYGQTAVHVINGKTVMVIENIRTNKNGSITPLTSGKIQLQSEGAEIYFKSIDIRPITGIPIEVISTIASN